MNNIKYYIKISQQIKLWISFELKIFFLDEIKTMVKKTKKQKKNRKSVNLCNTQEKRLKITKHFTIINRCLFTTRRYLNDFIEIGIQPVG